MSARRPKVLVLGYARHGKDTAGEMLSEAWGLHFVSSSMFCAEHIVMPAMNASLPGMYDTVEKCYADRGDHRKTWYELIRDFNRPDATSLGRAIFGEYDVYCGLRSKAELNALRNARVFDLSIWIDRLDHLPPEPTTSCTVEPWMADYVVDNNGTMDGLRLNLASLMNTWLPAWRAGN